MTRSLLVLAFFLLAFTALGEARVVEAKVTTETRLGRDWTVLSGSLDDWIAAPVAAVERVVTDWASYPRLFSKVKSATFELDGDATLLTENTVVSALGIEVKSRFTLRVRARSGAEAQSRIIEWSQEKTDGTIDSLEGGWRLVPEVRNGREGTRVTYRTRSAVPQSMPGEAGLVGLFFPGELKQIMSAVLKDVRTKESS